MSVHMSERSICIICPHIYCDACAVSLNLVGELTDVKLERLPGSSRTNVFSSEGLFKIPGIPMDEQTARKAMQARGWKTETLHNRIMDFCPECQAK